MSFKVNKLIAKLSHSVIAAIAVLHCDLQIIY